jgi:hypothetical protein
VKRYHSPRGEGVVVEPNQLSWWRESLVL